MSITAIFDRLPAARLGARLADAFTAALWRHRYVHAMAVGTLVLAIAVGAKTGNMPDFSVIEEFGRYLVTAFTAFGCGLGIVRLGWLAFVERSPAPLGDFIAYFARLLADIPRMANGLNGFIAVAVFSCGFSVLKGAIAVLSPFTWDRAFSAADRLLTLGAAPYERLWWLIESPLAVIAFNFVYNFWFFLVLGMIFAIIFVRRDTALRHQFLAAFMLTWTLGGFFVAMGFSSAGPCYFARLGLGGDYQPLMDVLAATSRDYSVWALATQDALWKGYIDPSSGSVGISAFPSMHVATATLLALYGTCRSRLAGVLLWVFASLIFLGSIVLGWHYAIDGIGGALIALALWKAAGRWFAGFEEA